MSLTCRRPAAPSVRGLTPPPSAPTVPPAIRPLRLDFLVGLRDCVLLLPGQLGLREALQAGSVSVCECDTADADIERIAGGQYSRCGHDNPEVKELTE